MSGTLFTILFVGPRLVFSLRKAASCPRDWPRCNPRFRTPHVAVLLHTVIAWAYRGDQRFPRGAHGLDADASDALRA